MRHLFSKFIACTSVLFLASVMWAQDIIVTTDAEKIEAKIFEVSKTEIKYKEKSNLNGPTFVLETKEISSIIYSNGKVVLYNQQKTSEPQNSSTSEPTSNQEIEATSNVAEANSFNVEILLLSGQIIKGILMEKANDYVAYTYNGKYFKTPASKVDKVTDIRNGAVTEYKGASLDSPQNKSQLTTQTKKRARIYRDNGEYMYNNTYISAKEVERILEREDYVAYDEWKKANGMLIGGAICAGIGGGLVLGGIYPLIIRRYDVALGLECSAIVPLGIGLGLAFGSSAHYRKAIDIYNSKSDNTAVQLRWGIGPNGVGLAIAF